MTRSWVVSRTVEAAREDDEQRVAALAGQVEHLAGVEVYLVGDGREARQHLRLHALQGSRPAQGLLDAHVPHPLDTPPETRANPSSAAEGM